MRSESEMNIIRMAREAGFESNSLGVTYTSGWLPDLLERFAALAAAAERERVTFELVNEAQRAVQEAVWAEREACAKVCERLATWNTALAIVCADAIRARGEE